MALADYYGRNAQAVSQIVGGFDATVFEQTARQLRVAVSYGPDVAAASEGRALLDLLVRLLARFYPAITILGPDGELKASRIDLAHAINPAIETSIGTPPPVGIVIGANAEQFGESIFAGSDGWTGRVGAREPFAVGTSAEPYGAGIAACLAAGRLFRRLVLNEAPTADDEELKGAGTMGAAKTGTRPFEAVLVGCGAVGNAAAWALARATDEGRLHLVDPERLELSNLQRYILANRADEHLLKVDQIARYFEGPVRGLPFEGDWRAFVGENGYEHEFVAVGVDSAEDRRGVQASLPRVVVNAWTQAGDLGVSTHSAYGGVGACLACLYLPTGPAPNEDEIYARALGVPQLVADVRTLLHQGTPVGEGFVEAVAVGLGQPLELLEPFAARPIRELYVQGICGGAVLPLGAIGRVGGDVHVPLAHQSALAGVLLAACLIERVRSHEPPVTRVAQVDVLRPIGPRPTHDVAAREQCLCADADFRHVYAQKWGATSEWGATSDPGSNVKLGGLA